MLTLYLLIKVVHVFAAIVAVGTNITYGVWIGRAKRDPGTLPFALRGVKFLDDRVANPCLRTSRAHRLRDGRRLEDAADDAVGSERRSCSCWSFSPSAMFGYTPTLRRQIEALDRVRRLVSRIRDARPPQHAAWCAMLGVLVAAIVMLMVVKPQLWG